MWKEGKGFFRRMSAQFVFLLCLLASRSALYADSADAGQRTSTIQELSAEIHAQLDGLKRQSRALTEQLLIAENELRTSSREVEALKTELSDLNTSLTATNQKLGEYSEKLTEYEAKLKARARVIRAAAALLAAFVAVRAVLLFLKVKFGIRIPYIVNLLL